jgi:hypothetical protein
VHALELKPSFAAHHEINSALGEDLLDRVRAAPRDLY